MIIIVGNFSGESESLQAMGKADFMKAHQGLVNVDLEAIWQQVETAEKRSNKSEKPPIKK